LDRERFVRWIEGGNMRCGDDSSASERFFHFLGVFAFSGALSRFIVFVLEVRRNRD
jgi:hypothetical protein